MIESMLHGFLNLVWKSTDVCLEFEGGAYVTNLFCDVRGK
jgi:hypothetical protein